MTAGEWATILIAIAAICITIAWAGPSLVDVMTRRDRRTFLAVGGVLIAAGLAIGLLNFDSANKQLVETSSSTSSPPPPSLLSSPLASSSAASSSPSVSSGSAPQPSSPPSSPSEVGYYLANYNAVQTYGINVDSTPRNVNGVMYDHPVVWYASARADDPYWAEWNLSRNCEWLVSPGVGISDEAPTPSRYIFYVLTDGADKWQKTISLAQSYPVKVSIKGALRLRLSVAGLENGYYGQYATWGDARVLCNSEPPNRKG